MIRAITAALLASLPALAAEPPARVTGIFSDLRSVPAEGGLLGTEIFIIPAQGFGHLAFFQCANGAAPGFLIVPLAVQGDRVRFSVPASSTCAGDYDARITRTGLEGTQHQVRADGSIADLPVRLKRKTSYWQ